MKTVKTKSLISEIRELSGKANDGASNNPQFDRIIATIKEVAEAGGRTCWVDYRIESLTQQQLRDEGFEVVRNHPTSWEISW